MPCGDLCVAINTLGSACCCSCDILTFLLKHGSSPNIIDCEERKCMHWAAASDNADAIRILVAASAAIDPRDRELRTPLHYAGKLSHLHRDHHHLIPWSVQLHAAT